MKKSNILFIGLDVHKESIEVAMADEVRLPTQCSTTNCISRVCRYGN